MDSGVLAVPGARLFSRLQYAYIFFNSILQSETDFLSFDLNNQKFVEHAYFSPEKVAERVNIKRKNLNQPNKKQI